MAHSDDDSLAFLKAENARLIALLESHGIAWSLPAPEPKAPAAPPSGPLQLSTDEKVRLFRRLFQGRTDVYPVRWESKTTGKAGYSPACANEWRAGICQKPRIKCADCSHQFYEVDCVAYRASAPNPQWGTPPQDSARYHARNEILASIDGRT